MAQQLICGKQNISLETPTIMGIINLNPQSFSAKGRITEIDHLLNYAEEQVKAGAQILDLGAEPTNPFIEQNITEELEQAILLPAVEKIAKNIDCIISVDTSKPQIMREAIKLGANFINDVRALIEPGAIEIIAENQVACCLMHMVFPFGKNYPQPHGIGEDIIGDIVSFLKTRVDVCLKQGIKKESIVIDPGIGSGNFGKNTAQNLKILKEIPELKKIGYPVLIGVSRKAFIGEITAAPEAARLPASLAATVIALLNGANMIRTHDVAEIKQAVQLVEFYKNIL